MAGSEISEFIGDDEGGMAAAAPLDTFTSRDLKALLSTITDQIAEADRRHSDTLHQLQERLAGLGHETHAIKPRLPDRYAAAFERIEAGVAELANRIAEAAEARESAQDATFKIDYSARSGADESLAVNAPPVFGSTMAFDDPPAALRAPGTAPSPRHYDGVDTFDIIESDLPSGSELWDRGAAEALTDLYETSFDDTPASSYSADPEPYANPEPYTAPNSYAPTEPAVSNIVYNSSPTTSLPDKTWLEDRFSEIAKHIEESLNEARASDSFSALNQRVDQFEQNLTAAIDGIANRGDVEGVHELENHLNQLARDLESAHGQLMRLDDIERQLSSIAEKLDDVHQAATMAVEGAADDQQGMAAGVDLDSVARTAAEAAAAEFSKFQPAGAAPFDTGELADMLRNFIAESRQGDENTAALLDTMQQAMIRLLDRVDNMEIAAYESAPEAPYSAAAPEPYAMMPADGERAENLDAAVAAVAAGRQAASAPSYAEDEQDAPAPIAYAPNAYEAAAAPAASEEQRSPERIRQDFVAEARRAKMRLTAEAEAAVEGAGREAFEAAAEASTAPSSPAADAPEAAPNSIAALRGKARAAKVIPDPAEEKKQDKKKDKAAAAGSSRVRVLALALLLALGGAYVTMQSGLLSGGEPAADPVAAPAAELPVAPATPEATAPNPAAAPATGSGAEELNLPEGTRGEIVPGEFAVGSTSVPLYGVTVDSERPVTAEGLERARRQQAMAAVSEQLGQAAVRNGTATAIPAAVDPQSAASLPGASQPDDLALGGLARSQSLDLPPATVGPLSLRLAAANGDPSAEFEVGARLAEGKGTEQTFKDAAKWYHRAAAKGLAQAQYRLGTLYERGLGVTQDQSRAEDWYRRAADQGNVKAMHNLAVLRANSKEGSPDYINAALWFEKAAEYGLPDSQFNLAVLKENGLGVPQDMVSAYKWLSLAAKSGDKEALRRRDILKGKLTATELADAEKRVATFRIVRSDPNVNDAFRAGEAWKKASGSGI